MSLVVLLAALTNCVSPSRFKVTRTEDEQFEIQLTRDRIVMECEKIDEERSGFMIHVLDDKKRVLVIAQGNAIETDRCLERIQVLNRLLKRGNQIYIGGYGTMNSENPKKYPYTFPGHGTFYGPEVWLDFVVIANEHGDCYDAHSLEEKPCPREGFPINPSKR